MPDAALLAPLDRFYAAAGLALPWAEAVEPAAVPEPYRRLLVHRDDMTPTLEAFHGDRIHLRVLSVRIEAGLLAREVVLVLDRDETPVEFGAIIIHLDAFPPDARAEIRACRRPLGTIMAVHRVEHVSSPRGYFRVAPDATIGDALRLASPATLFGRQNVHLRPDGVTLAEIVEILPLSVIGSDRHEL